MAISDPSVSIIITCYNYEKYVGEAIDSVLSQPYADREIIVIDDGSRDESWKVISSYGDKIKSIRSTNKGSVEACCLGSRMSKGKYVMFLDADDVMYPDALEHIMAQAQHDVSKVQFRLQPIDGNGRPISVPFPAFEPNMQNSALIESISLHGYYTTPPTSGNLYRRDVYELVGKPDYDWGIDGVSYLLAPFVGRVVTVDSVYAMYRMHGANMTSLSKLSSDRLLLESRVFLRRLSHLGDILTTYQIPSGAFAPKSEYRYSLERQVYAAILGRDSISFRMRFAYLRRVWSETSGAARLMYMAYSLVLTLLPQFVARQVMLFRLDSGRTSALRNFAKKVLKRQKPASAT